jgi:hypothetical protein
VEGWKWLLVNECKCKNAVSSVMEFLNMFQDGTNVSLFWVIIMVKNDISMYGTRGGIVVKALCYKPLGRGFDSRWCHWNFSVT